MLPLFITSQKYINCRKNSLLNVLLNTEYIYCIYNIEPSMVKTNVVVADKVRGEFQSFNTVEYCSRVGESFFLLNEQHRGSFKIHAVSFYKVVTASTVRGKHRFVFHLTTTMTQSWSKVYSYLS